MALSERTVSQLLSHRAATDPERPFLLWKDRRLTFREVESDAEALAAALANLGIEAGDRVAVILPTCPEFVVATFALAKLGAVVVPLDPRLTQPELHYMLRHSEAVCAVTIETWYEVDYLQLFENLIPLLPELQYLVTVGKEDLWYDDRIFQFEDLVSAGRGREYRNAATDPDDEVFALLYTSGTTGKPKGVELTHRNLVFAATATADGAGLTEEDRVIGVTAFHHVFGLGPGILGCAASGATLILQEEYEAGGTLDLIEKHRATIHFGVPTLFVAELAEQQRDPREISSLRLGVVAGAPMGDGLLRDIQSFLCPALLTAYSLTETASTAAMTRPSDPEEKRRQTVGRLVPGMELRVLERDGSILPVESLGELAVRGPGVMKGYYRQPKGTAAATTPDGFFLTGDLGMLDEEGFLHLVGRSKEVIIRSGFNIYPQELEDRLNAHPAVQSAVVVGVRDELLGEAIAAAIVPVEGAIVNGEELRAWCRRTLADHKIPDSVHFLDAFPLTGTGKVRRVELARLLEARRSSPET